MFIDLTKIPEHDVNNEDVVMVFSHNRMAPMAEILDTLEKAGCCKVFLHLVPEDEVPTPERAEELILDDMERFMLTGEERPVVWVNVDVREGNTFDTITGFYRMKD